MSTSITFVGYLNDVLQGSVTTTLGTRFSLCNIGLNNLDRFDVRNGGNDLRWWLVGDLT